MCTELAVDRAYCVNMVSGYEQEIDDTHFLKNPDGSHVLDQNGYAWSWWKMKPFMLQIPYFDFVELKKFIRDQCKKDPGACNSTVSSWDQTLDNIESVYKQK